MSNPLNHLIPGEIRKDDFANWLTQLAQRPDVQHVLEIGSSAGDGSTLAFVEGIKAAATPTFLYCLEISSQRLAALKDRYDHLGFVKAHQASSVGIDQYLSEKEVRHFCATVNTGMNRYPIDQILGWRQENLEYQIAHAVPQNGIEQILNSIGLTHFDLVLIDGALFTSKAEMDLVYGAKIIALDDVDSLKNHDNYHRLKKDPAYKLLHENRRLRNGFAIFERLN